MTLNDIGRMLKIARVPRSKTVSVSYTNPCFIVHVPQASHMLIANVVGNLKLATDNVKVVVLESREVRDGEHVLVKVKGDNRLSPRDRTAETAWAYNRRRQAQNRNIVIDCASVVL